MDGSVVGFPTIFWRLGVVGNMGLVEPWLPGTGAVVRLAFCGGVGLSLPSFRLILCVFSLSWAARSVAASEFMWGWSTLGLLGGSLEGSADLSAVFLSGLEL
ncbi:hypothetical protein DPEC_G00257350 [Dallia pectoralis]|uniref:Uncharacterized protein n=1 Tax=Dallia pectoralis TaxID=75939 RepID=A0ACC2FQR7_DALPE|nr:hypothetical protein DPEC_G00257350 [Dallia pectoralis]